MGLALRSSGWHVTGTDEHAPTLAQALELGAVDAAGVDPTAELTVIATPVGSVPQLARQAPRAWGVVTDVGSVKAPVVAAVDEPCFVGGHPMAGSEALGIEGARADLFHGATWALTPNDRTDPDALSLVHSVVRSLGAEVVTLDPQRHDRLVATVSHVPHLTAAALMSVADDRAVEHPALKRLAAGGFRDMTRIAAGDPRIWLDICNDNADAICEVLDGLLESLSEIRSIVAEQRNDELAERLTRAQVARRNLPSGAPAASELVEMRVEVTDRPGELAAVTTMATEADINVYDIEVLHAVGAAGAMLILVVAREDADAFSRSLEISGRHVGVHPMGDA
ncbi:MAG: prephenate dehydrogenase/arogenate dehydrogenase family protein [Microthrixaceae bacterium]|nr:prephenate dehydrogenase/arogenate dehydrogenase family protein [Microthrixaceae bacterium]